ncbi:L-threonylcarbamoyladenylate synthase [Thioalkalivibrio sp.]|uniref:L-threonylcarbamoyladenylate synthase n=1 Tax=Thioalkalivibrio sp. TaxID=2093813 RepID=UPI0035694326
MPVPAGDARETRVSADIEAIATVVRNGGVIAYPTEAVFGLGCRPADAAAFERLLEIKNRDVGKGVIVITDDLSRVAHWLEPVPEAMQAMAEASWPGPHTWLWPARPACPDWLRGRHTRLAVRVTAHASVRALCSAAGSALVSTSANRSGAPPCRDTECVRRHFEGRVDGILDRPCGEAERPSSIRDMVTGAWIRGGPVAR